MSKKEDSGQSLHADSAYRSEEIEEMLRRKNVESQIHEKGYRCSFTNQKAEAAYQKEVEDKGKNRAYIRLYDEQHE